ncbi:MAG: hypothetical protein MK106_16315, partial [Mariniblastus sp.]|nr:hypothetical protein [Mariniblastus sp.]
TAFKDRDSRHWRLEKMASCHPSKPVGRMPYERRPELQYRVQSIRAGTVFIPFLIGKVLPRGEFSSLKFVDF